jgi:Domain of unknown function (DUF6602)
VKDSHPDFLALSKIEEDLLVGKLDAARKAISHAGEKGRSLEAEVTTLLRSFLPEEYGLTTGFVVYHTHNGPSLSPQLDVIIYDPVRSGPIARLATCDVLPLEAVYGYVEVKASLQSTSDSAKEFADNSIEMCIKKNQQVRGMTERRVWKPAEGSPVQAELVTTQWMSIRSYVFAFEAEGAVAKNPDLFAQRIADVSARFGPPVHWHGVFVAGQGYYTTRAIDVSKARLEDWYHTEYTTEQPLAAFKWSLIHGLARFPRFPGHWTPAVDKYHEDETTWKSRAPQRG